LVFLFYFLLAEWAGTEEDREPDNVKPYGYELILDLHDCNVSTFNRESIDKFFSELCDFIDMQKCERFFWDDIGVPEEEKQTSPHTTGTSAVQFILTSSIVIHTLDKLGKVYINIFSCKTFDADAAADFSWNWFKGHIANKTVINRL